MKKIIYTFLILCVANIASAQEKEMSLSLDEAINYALDNSYNTKIAENDIKAANKKKWETTTIGLPQVNAQVDYQNWLKQQVSLIDINGDGVDDELTFGTKQNLNATVTLSQLIFDGSYLVGLQSAKTYLQISEQAKIKTDLTTRETVINAYGNVLVAEESIKILERNQKVNDKILNDATVSFKNGLSEEEDVEQFEIIKGNLENNIRSAKRLKDIAYKLLNISLGLDANTKLTLTDSLNSLVLKNTDLSLLATPFNLESNIDYNIAKNNKESKRLLMKLEQSKALPTLSAFANYGTTGNANSFNFLNGNQKWFESSLLGVSLNIPIFSSLKRSAKTAQAKIAFESADIQLEEAKQRLSLAAENAKSDYQLSIDNFTTAEKNLNLAERIEKKQQIKFNEGITTSFDLLQAQNQLYTQQNNYVQAMLNIIAKKAALENALNSTIKK